MPDFCGYIKDDDPVEIVLTGSTNILVLDNPGCFYDTKSFQDAFNEYFDYEIKYDPTTKKYKHVGGTFTLDNTTNTKGKEFLGISVSGTGLADNPTILPEGRHTTPKFMSCHDSTAVSDHTKERIEKKVRMHSSLHTMKKMTLAIQCSNEKYNDKINKHASKDDAYARYLAKRKRRLHILPCPPAPPPELFEFTTHTFTNADSAGTDPPTLSNLQTAYSDATWASDTSFLSVNLYYNAQKFTIPQSGRYSIQARGAAGGPISGQSPAGSNGPGLGYEHQADFSLTKGEHLYIIVGQMGQTVVRTSSQASPGGGGSFVFTESSGIETLLMAGAGGNGGSWETHEVRDPDGRAPGEADPAAADGIGRGSNGGSWQADAVIGGAGDPDNGQAQGIGIGGGLDAKGANYLSANSNQQNYGNATGKRDIGGGFGGGGTATPYEGGGGGGYIGGFAKKTNSYYNRHLDYGALSYVQSSATDKVNLGVGSAATHGRIILRKL